MSINPIQFNLASIAPISAPIQPKGAEKTAAGAGSSFGEMFQSAIKEVDQLQHQADTQIENLIVGKEGATTHGAMLALEKADTAFQLMNNIRSKIIRVYEDILRTQV